MVMDPLVEELYSAVQWWLPVLGAGATLTIIIAAMVVAEHLRKLASNSGKQLKLTESAFQHSLVLDERRHLNSSPKIKSLQEELSKAHNTIAELQKLNLGLEDFKTKVIQLVEPEMLAKIESPSENNIASVATNSVTPETRTAESQTDIRNTIQKLRAFKKWKRKGRKDQRASKGDERKKESPAKVSDEFQWEGKPGEKGTEEASSSMSQSQVPNSQSIPPPPSAAQTSNSSAGSQRNHSGRRKNLFDHATASEIVDATKDPEQIAELKGR